MRPTPVTQPLCQARFQHCLRGLGAAEGPCGLGSSLSFTTNLHPASLPTPDFKHRITVQASPGLDRRRNVFEVGAGDSPTFPRFRAIQCKKLRLPLPMPLPPDLILLSVRPYPWKWIPHTVSSSSPLLPGSLPYPSKLVPLRSLSSMHFTTFFSLAIV